MRTVDRLAFAAEIAKGRRVLDIGGQKMPGCNPSSPFARVYRRIQDAAAEYRIADVQARPEVDYVLDLNVPEGVTKLRDALREYRPDCILCMETLEHVNYHFEAMNVMAGAVAEWNARVFITVPNNGNWVFNALNWNTDHSIAFLRDVADRFVRRSALGRHRVTLYGCMQKYLWFWWIVYLMAFGQPFSWGFLVEPAGGGEQAAGRGGAS